MKNIESYNSSYPLAYYEVGMVYSFYGQASAKGTPASSDSIQKYAPTLDALVIEELESAIKPVKGTAATSAGRGGMNRFYAVVIDKVRAGNSAYIVVMLCNKYNGKSEYYTRKYSVNYGCATDGKDLVPVSTHLGFESKINSKIGGVTRVTEGNKVGGITRANGKNSSITSVGGITKVHSSNIQNQSASNSPSSTSKVGGITLVRERKIGGITRAKK